MPRSPEACQRLSKRGARGTYDSALEKGAMDGEREVDQAVVEGLEVKLS